MYELRDEKKVGDEGIKEEFPKNKKNFSAIIPIIPIISKVLKLGLIEKLVKNDALDNIICDKNLPDIKHKEAEYRELKFGIL